MLCLLTIDCKEGFGSQYTWDNLHWSVRLMRNIVPVYLFNLMKWKWNEKIDSYGKEVNYFASGQCKTSGKIFA